jgi:hypothetical protein
MKAKADNVAASEMTQERFISHLSTRSIRADCSARSPHHRQPPRHAELCVSRRSVISVFLSRVLCLSRADNLCHSRGSDNRIGSWQESPKGERYLWLDPYVLNKLKRLRGPGESYSDVIIRLADESER